MTTLTKWSRLEMSEQRQFTQSEGAFGGNFHHDKAFEPHSSFDFEDDFLHLGTNINSFNTFGGDAMDYHTAGGIP